MLSTKIDRHLDSCAQIAASALVATGALVGFADVSHSAAYTTTTVYSVYTASAGPTLGVVYIDVDSSPGTMLMVYVAGATPAGGAPVGGLTFGSYAGFELAIGFGAYGPQIYDNPGDSKTLTVYGASYYGYYAYPYNLALGATIDASDPWVAAAYSIEVTNFNSYWSTPTGDSGYVGFKLYDGSTSTFGYFYLYSYDAGGSPYTFKTGKAGWDSTASSITIGGVVPEPSSASLGLLAAGAASLGSWRRRRAAD